VHLCNILGGATNGRQRLLSEHEMGCGAAAQRPQPVHACGCSAEGPQVGYSFPRGHGICLLGGKAGDLARRWSAREGPISALSTSQAFSVHTSMPLASLMNPKLTTRRPTLQRWHEPTLQATSRTLRPSRPRHTLDEASLRDQIYMQLSRDAADGSARRSRCAKVVGRARHSWCWTT
jgi:hypothetical protein